MKLLVSAVNASEAAEAAKGGADIIDIKNIEEGALGASFPWVIGEIKNALLKTNGNGKYELSATLGDLEFKPGGASLAAYGLASFNLNYIKIGMKVKSRKDAAELASAVKRATKEKMKKAPKIILAAYADFIEISSVSPLDVIYAAHKAGVGGVMIDTYQKDGRSLFEHLDADYLSKFVKKAREKKLLTCLAGSISLDDLPEIKKIKPDIVGIRSAACTTGDRKKGKIERERVKKIRQEFSKLY